MRKAAGLAWLLPVGVAGAGFADAGFAGAQGVGVTAGSSSMSNAAGATVALYRGESTSELSVGRGVDGWIVGFADVIRRGDAVIRLGDSAEVLTLPTDLDAGGRAVVLRGAAISKDGPRGGYKAFAGQTGDALQLGFLRGVEAKSWLGAAEGYRAIGPRMTVSAVAAAGASDAALVAGAYRVGKSVEVSATAGVTGAGAALRVALKAAGMGWRVRIAEGLGELRLQPEDPNLSVVAPERTGLNVDGEARVGRLVHVDGAQVKYQADVAAGLAETARLDEVGVTARSGGLGAGVRFLSSSDGVNRSSGGIVTVEFRRERWEATAMGMRSRSDAGGMVESMWAQGRVRIGNHVKATGGVDVSAGNGAGTMGLEVRMAMGTAGVSQQMVYVPFGPGAGFSRVTQVSIQLHPFGRGEVGFAGLAGRGVPTLYNVVGSTFVETNGPAGDMRASQVRMGRYVVRGRVVDEDGVGVASAAVRVGREMVWTDSAGEFLVRMARPERVMVGVSSGDFLGMKRYVAVGEGVEVLGVLERDAVGVVLRVKGWDGVGR